MQVMALRRIAYLLVPGGILRLHDLIFDCQPADAAAVLRAWMDSAATDPAQGYTAGDHAEHIRTGFGTFRRPLEPMLAAGFEILASGFSASVYGEYTCVRIWPERRPP